jgi:hypothetical protein
VAGGDQETSQSLARRCPPRGEKTACLCAGS